MGGQRSMAALIEHLDRDRFRPLAVTTRPDELSERLEELDCPVHFFPLSAISKDAAGRVIGNIRRFRAMYRSEGVRIVHPDAERDVVVAGLAKFGTGVRLLWHARVTGRNKLDPLVVRLADQVVGVSDGVQKRFSRPLLEGKYQTIFNGVDLRRFRPRDDRQALREACAMPDDRPILLFAGQIKKEKGIFDLVEAMQLLRERRSGPEMPVLYMLGTPIRQVELEQLERAIGENNLEDCVRVIPQQSNIEEWMAAADVLMLPSHEGSEGMGRVVFEAMACGLVPVASDISGVREAVTAESGVLVPQRNPTILASTVDSLLGDPARIARLREGGLQRARDVFDIRLHARNIERVYEKMLKG